MERGVGVTAAVVDVAPPAATPAPVPPPPPTPTRSRGRLRGPALRPPAPGPRSTSSCHPVSLLRPWSGPALARFAACRAVVGSGWARPRLAPRPPPPSCALLAPAGRVPVPTVYVPPARAPGSCCASVCVPCGSPRAGDGTTPDASMATARNASPTAPSVPSRHVPLLHHSWHHIFTSGGSAPA